MVPCSQSTPSCKPSPLTASLALKQTQSKGHISDSSMTRNPVLLGALYCVCVCVPTRCARVCL